MSLNDPNIIIRPFLPGEWQQYKAIRLEALQLERGMFGNAYDTEAAYPDEQWQDSVVNPRMGRFGLWDSNEPIGVTGIVKDQDRPEEAYMTQSYIRKAYRGKGLSRKLYEARLAWARENGVKKLIIGHRETNLASKAANQRFGFKYTHKEQRTWPDGAIADMLYYELEL